MIYEVVSANVDQGLFKGTKGFCPVAVTEGMNKELLKPLVDLARKQAKAAETIKPNEAKGLNDFYSFFPLKIAGERYCLLTRGICISEASPDRKFIIHQILVPHANNWTCGPVAILAKEDAWVTQWSTKPQFLQARQIDAPTLSPRICRNWELKTRDSGWAGTPIEAYEKRSACLVITDSEVESKDILELFLESQSLLKYQERWNIPFSIRAWHPFGKENHFWSVVDRGTQEEIDFMHVPETMRIDLTHSMAQATGKFASAARSGNWAKLQTGRKEKQASEDDDIKLAPVEDREPMTPSSLNLGSPSSLNLGGAQSSTQLGSQSSDKLKAKSSTKLASGQPAQRAGGGKPIVPAEAPPVNLKGEPVEQPVEEPVSDVTSAAPASSKWIPSTTDGWIRTGIVAAVVLSLGIGIWYLIGMIQQTLKMADSMGGDSIAIIGGNGGSDDDDDASNKKDGEDTDEGGTDSDVESKPKDLETKTPSKEVDGSGDSEKALNTKLVVTKQMVIDAIESADLSTLDLLPPGETQDQILLSLPFPKEQLHEFLSLNVNTSKNRNPMTWNRTKDKANLNLGRSGKTAASISLVERPISAEGEEKEGDSGATQPEGSDTELSIKSDVITDFVFAWNEDDPPSWEDYYPVMAGRFEVGVFGKRDLVTRTLAKPIPSESFSLSEASFEGVGVIPHLEKYLTIQSGFQQFEWKPSRVRVVGDNLKTDSEDSSVPIPVWIGSASKRSFRLELNEKLIRSEVAKLLKIDLDSPNRMLEVLDSRLKYHLPIGVEALTTFSIDRELEKQVKLKLKSQFLFDAKGQDFGTIYFSRVVGVKSDAPAKKKVTALSDLLISRLLQHTDTNGKVPTRIISRGGKGAGAAPTDELKVSLAIAGVYYQYVMKLLEQEVELEISRTGTNSSRSGANLSREFEIPVTEFQDEPGDATTEEEPTAVQD